MLWDYCAESAHGIMVILLSNNSDNFPKKWLLQNVLQYKNVLFSTNDKKFE